MNKTFYSNGKLLLTGEYLVLDGATALAIPTKKGQSLTVSLNNEHLIKWKSFDHLELCWFECEFKMTQGAWEIQTTSDSKISKTLQNILATAQQLNESFLKGPQGHTINTHLDFPRNWGLGTSSTLINNLAQWANVDAFQLLDLSFGGSGYDIAAAQNDSPVLYKRDCPPTFRIAHLPWEFKEQLYFIHLNQKQDSKEGIARYRNSKVSKQLLQKISDVSEKLLLCYDLGSFQQLLESHERLVSEVINLPTVKDRLFPDFKGTIKSLGAWGGDFVLVTATPSQLDYFKNKGYRTVVPFNEMIK